MDHPWSGGRVLAGRHFGDPKLAFAPDQINFGALVRHTEDDFALVECLKVDGGCCLISPACRLKNIVREALEGYLAVFDKYSLADLVKNADALRSLLLLEPADDRHGNSLA